MALKPQQLEAIDLHMAGETYPEIAFRLGVSPRSVERWASSHEWKQEVHRRLESRREASIALEKQATAKAWEVVLAVLRDGNDPKTQLDAAKFLITRADRLAPPPKPEKRSGGLSDDTVAFIRAKILGLDIEDDDFEEIWNRAQNAKSA